MNLACKPRLLFLAALCMLLVTTDLGFIAEGKPSEQVEFAMEGPVVRPVPLPEGALQVLRRTKTVLDCSEESESGDGIEERWFIASEVHLSASGGTGLVVMPRSPDGACLLKAHTMPFWVVRKTGGAYVVALEDNVLTLRILSTVSHKLRDIETTAVNLNETTKWLYRFDGEKYTLSKKISTRQQ